MLARGVVLNEDYEVIAHRHDVLALRQHRRSAKDIERQRQHHAATLGRPLLMLNTARDADVWRHDASAGPRDLARTRIRESGASTHALSGRRLASRPISPAV